jgi:disulfide bond formation protein DsbB
MDTQTVTLFLALLAVVTQVFVALSVALAALARVSPAAARLRAAAHAQIAPQSLALAFLIAAVAMGGSLYFSEVANFPPCRLCWYQRIAMYPQAFLLGLALIRRDQGIRAYAILLSSLGALISCWHLLVERYPTLESSYCDPTNPCSIKWVERFGYLTIPGMALSGFLGIIVLAALYRPARPGTLPQEIS